MGIFAESLKETQELMSEAASAEAQLSALDSGLKDTEDIKEGENTKVVENTDHELTLERALGIDTAQAPDFDGPSSAPPEN